MVRNRAAYVAVAIACAALALSIYGVVRGGGEARGAHVCVDQEARGDVTEMCGAIARMGRSARVAGGAPVPVEPGMPPMAPPSTEAAEPALAPAPGPRRFVRFDVPNPAVTVTQTDDGLLDIRTTDPSLAGSVLTITAITDAGDEEKLLVRVPL